jgi:Domain of unknown function (DUF4304)
MDTELKRAEILTMKYAMAVAEVISRVEALGFVPRGTSLYRKSPDSRVEQLVFIQSGRSHLAGKFTVAMGAFLPSVHEIEWAEKSPKFPDITKCQIQTRLSEFAGAGDIWWSSNHAATILELEPAIQTEIPRFFAEWGEVPAMLDSWARLRDRTKLRVSDFAIAAILHEEHRDRDAIALLETMYIRLQDTGKDVKMIKSFASKLGLNLSV